MSPSPMMRDTRTPEQKRIAALEKLCQQQHEALEQLEWASFEENEEAICPECGSWKSLNKHAADCVLAKQIAAYAALFPKTGGA